MKVFNKSSFLFFLFIITFSIPSNAVIDYKPDADKKTTIVKKHKKVKKKGLFKRWKEKLILKKLKKRQKRSERNSFTQKADISLTLGVGSLLFWVAAFLSLVLVVSDYFIVAFLILAFLSALIGSIFSISILRKTKQSKEQYRKERRKAKWGLAFSLLSGLPAIVILPLLIFLIS